ncbi:unannotated protein [freshwater metagenome]|uniref:Unannotated protein n=1 Tax=freshwater metagenome TaxID=449393 RepID=A0A6J7DXQ9_9ZZZZ
MTVEHLGHVVLRLSEHEANRVGSGVTVHLGEWDRGGIDVGIAARPHREAELLQPVAEYPNSAAGRIRRVVAEPGEGHDGRRDRRHVVAGPAGAKGRLGKEVEVSCQGYRGCGIKGFRDGRGEGGEVAGREQRIAASLENNLAGVLASEHRGAEGRRGPHGRDGGRGRDDLHVRCGQHRLVGPAGEDDATGRRVEHHDGEVGPEVRIVDPAGESCIDTRLRLLGRAEGVGNGGGGDDR